MKILEKLSKRVQEAGTLACVGLDADFEKLPERFKTLEHPQFEFNKWIIDETHEFVSSFKPNAAFYEARGDAGMRELKMTMDYLISFHPDIVTILDAKRADIGNTNAGYVTAVFDWLGFDAITLHPYLGGEALEPFLARTDKASVILCRTSNPGAGEFQDLVAEGKPLWQRVAEKVSKEWDKNGNCMLAVGATYPEEMKVIRETVGDMTFLVPGVGAQGGDVAAVLAAGKNSRGEGLIINSSRGVIFSENPGAAARALRDEIQAHR